MKSIFISVAAIAITLTGFSQNQNWTLDKNHARLGFIVTHLKVSEVEGYFKTFDIKLVTNGNELENAKIEVTAEINSIDTDNETRDNDLKSDHFFDAAKYPTLSFESKGFKKVEDKMYKLTGDLTMHGITRPVELDVKFNGTIEHPRNKRTIAGFTVTGKLKRSDFNIGPGLPVLVVSDEVQILANAEFSMD